MAFGDLDNPPTTPVPPPDKRTGQVGPLSGNVLNVHLGLCYFRSAVLYNDDLRDVWAIFMRDTTLDVETAIFTTTAARCYLQHGPHSNRGYPHPRIPNNLPRSPALSHQGPIPPRPPR